MPHDVHQRLYELHDRIALHVVGLAVKRNRKLQKIYPKKFNNFRVNCNIYNVIVKPLK